MPRSFEIVKVLTYTHEEDTLNSHQWKSKKYPKGEAKGFMQINLNYPISVFQKTTLSLGMQS